VSHLPIVIVALYYQESHRSIPTGLLFLLEACSLQAFARPELELQLQEGSLNSLLALSMLLGRASRRSGIDRALISPQMRELDETANLICLLCRHNINEVTNQIGYKKCTYLTLIDYNIQKQNVFSTFGFIKEKYSS